ncbi:trypsin alpha-like [Drosophila ficusphila]|uniref:trypsin alpha-like n=1 Tax=Drosophila ficusphila TaxID=30025 RepID=UPI0007E8631C|nr:trypsin alpha-like [Drosophila ficusphila]
MFIKCFLLLSAINFLSAGRVPELEERIIGAEDIEIEAAPWQVSIQRRGNHICGGSIYSKDIIITAAHCRFSKEGKQLGAEEFQVRAGSSWIKSYGTLIHVAAIKSHEKYSKKTGVNDIAVMRLSEPLVFSSKVQSIPLAEKNPSPETLAKASGWGAVRVTVYQEIQFGEYPEHLKGVELLIQDCQNYLFTTEDNVCVHSRGKSTCAGDSGGPLVVDQQLVGVTSFGLGKKCDGFVAFAGVPAFRNWILNAVKSL